MKRLYAPWWGLLMVSLASCASQPLKIARPVSPKLRRLQLEPLKLLAIGTKVQLLDASGLFEAAGGLMDAKRYSEALTHYDRLLAHFPKATLAVPALYNAGLAHEALEQYERAAERYAQLVAVADSRDGIDAAFRLGGCYAELRRWKPSAEVFARLAKQSGLGAADRVEALARQGLALYHQQAYPDAERVMATALAFAARVQSTERLDNDFFLGMAHFYLAAVPHAQFRRLTVHAGKSMGRELDARAKLLISAQRRYITTIRMKNPYWATAAGFQIGSLYREFYTVLMTVLPDFSTAARTNARRAKIAREAAEKELVRVYLQEVHRRIRPLLSKAIRVFERNVVVGERVGVRSPWVRRSRQQVRVLKRLLLATPEEAVRLVPPAGQNPEDDPVEPLAPSAAKSPSPASRPSAPRGRALM